MNDTSVAELQVGPHLLRRSTHVGVDVCPACKHSTPIRRYAVTISDDDSVQLHVKYDVCRYAFKASVYYDFGEGDGSIGGKWEPTAREAYRMLVSFVASHAESYKREAQHYDTISALLLKAGETP